MNMFDEIDELSKDLPKIGKVANDVASKKVNNYQIISYVIMGVFIVVGIIFGNLFPSCGGYATLYYGKCGTTEFNFSFTLSIWFVGFLITVFFYGMGEVISLLRKISDSLKVRK